MRSLVYESEPCVPTHCTRKSYSFDATDDWPIEYLDKGLEECRDFSSGALFSIFLTCVTLIFALLGTMNRMKFSSDANIQKALGMVTDTIGFFSLAQLLFDYSNSCINAVDEKFKNSEGQRITGDIYLSIGWWCYVICLFGALMRCIFHWLTPLPHRGSHGIFVCALPEELVKLLDTDGDGKVSWKEMRMAFADIRRRQREHLHHTFYNATRLRTKLHFRNSVTQQPGGGKESSTRGPESSNGVVAPVLIGGDAELGKQEALS